MTGQLAFPAIAYIVVLGILYWVLCAVYLRDWFKAAPPQPEGALAPVAFLRPLKHGSPQLAECVEALLCAIKDGDQIIFGVDPGSPAAEVCAEAQTRHPGCDIVVVECFAGGMRNPKISKLAQLTPHARHDRLLVSDSEALFDAPFVDAFRAEWSACGADVLTAGYRFIELETWPQQTDAAATLLTLWPGLAWLRRFGRVRLTLGACTALRRRDLDAIGGWAAFGDDLAEDHRLGEALAAQGRKVRLSAQVVTLVSDALSWRDYWRHQRRAAVTYRSANPLGFAASIITHALASSIALALIPNSMGIIFGLVLFANAWLVRWWLTAADAARVLAFPIPRLGRVVLLASFVETACWFLSWFSRGVWWGGRWRRVDWRGKLLD